MSPKRLFILLTLAGILMWLFSKSTVEVDVSIDTSPNQKEELQSEKLENKEFEEKKVTSKAKNKKRIKQWLELLNPGPIARVLAQRALERPHSGVRRLMPSEPRRHGKSLATHIASEPLRGFVRIFGDPYLKWESYLLIQIENAKVVLVLVF